MNIRRPPKTEISNVRRQLIAFQRLRQEPPSCIDFKVMQAAVTKKQVTTSAVHEPRSFQTGALGGDSRLHRLGRSIRLEVDKKPCARVIPSTDYSGRYLPAKCRITSAYRYPVEYVSVYLFHDQVVTS
jgi:hypothetical protein